jgi:hypothetical protein
MEKGPLPSSRHRATASPYLAKGQTFWVCPFALVARAEAGDPDGTGRDGGDEKGALEQQLGRAF